MNITSYNVTDVAYHYVGLRVLGANAALQREEQTKAISQAINKYVRDRALRLLLPAPRGTFETVGEKVCQELVHLGFAHSLARSYKLTDLGRRGLALLDSREPRELRLLMTRAHLEHYDNFRYVLFRHVELGSILRPIVEAGRASDVMYLRSLLNPTLGESSSRKAESLLARVGEARGSSVAKRTEDLFREAILQNTLPQTATREPIFRALADRMNSLRLVNIARHRIDGAEFIQTYATSPMQLDPDSDPTAKWRVTLQTFNLAEPRTLWLCDPDVDNEEFLKLIMSRIDNAFEHLAPEGGYFDLPDVREFVARGLLISESVFDDSLNAIIDTDATHFSLGLQYERISSRRRPLQRLRDSVQIFNLIRRQ